MTVEINALLCPASVAHPRQSEASLLPFPDGRLLLAYSDFYGGRWHDEGPARIAGKWSHDAGRTWSDPFVLQENTARLNCMSASLWRLPTGRILLAYGYKDGQPGIPDAPPILHAKCTASDDDGRTWSPPRPITHGDAYWCMTNDRLVQLSTGRLLYPTGVDSTCQCWYSDDGGDTWAMSRRNIDPPPGIAYAEPAVIELLDGSVAMYIRTTAGNLHIALSDDAGLSWRLHKSHAADMCGHPDSGPNAAYAPCLLKRIPGTNDLLLVWNNNRLRTPLTAAISADQGNSWRHLRNLEEMDGWPPRLTHAYPSIAFLNGHVHLTYWETHTHPQAERFIHLRYRRLPLSWFYQ